MNQELEDLKERARTIGTFEFKRLEALLRAVEDRFPPDQCHDEAVSAFLSQLLAEEKKLDAPG